MKTVELKCVQTYHENGQIASEEYRLNEKRHNDNAPAYREYYTDGQVKFESYWLDGMRHNETGPAWREWYEDGQVEYEKYYLNGVRLSKAEFELRNVPSCANKQVVIDGVTYILTPIKE